MPNVVFFSYSETDRGVVLTIKGRAVNPIYPYLNFRVQDLLAQWDTSNSAVIRQAITKSMQGTSRTIVFVGNETYKSYWVSEEVKMTIQNRKPIYAIRLKDTYGPVPQCLIENGIHLYLWSEETLQRLATI